MDDTIPQKQCPKCKEIKPLTSDYFHRRSELPSGFASHCKKCRSTSKPPKIDLEHQGQKRCSTCKQWKPATPEFFFRDRSRHDGIEALCKQCKYAKEKQRRPSIRVDLVPDGYKRCTVCKEIKPATSEFFHQYKGIPRSRCKACRKMLEPYSSEAQHQKYLEKREYHLHRRRVYYEAHQQALLRNRRNYYNTHREKCKLAAKKSKAKHRRYYTTLQLNRHALTKRGSIGTHTHQDIQQQLQRQKRKCYYCHTPLGVGKRAYHVDHIVPLSRGGRNDPSNLVIACPRCNEQKGAKLLHEWCDGGRLL